MANITKIRLSGVTYNIIDESAIHSLEGYATSAQTQAAITAATDALAQSIAEQGYQTATDVENAISGKVDTSTYNTFTAATNASLADKLEADDVEKFADAVAYDSNAKEMKFYHGGTGGTEVFSFDASPFLIDGMVESVEIVTVENVKYLRITWNSAAQKQVTDIPLTDIFNPANYMTRTETEAAIENATSGKVDTSTYNTYTAATDTAIGGKQNALTAGDGIDITNNVISVTGAPLTTDTVMSNTSTNPVQNKVIKEYVDTEVAKKNQVVTIDSETLVIS